MAEGVTAEKGPSVRQAAVARAAGVNNAFGPRPGNLNAGTIQAKGYRSPNPKAQAERREAAQDRREATAKRHALVPNKKGEGFIGVETRSGAVRGGGGYAA